jgi:hypothetical protein
MRIISDQDDDFEALRENIAACIDNQSTISLNFYRCSMHINDSKFKWFLKKSASGVNIYVNNIDIKLEGHTIDKISNSLDYTMEM